MNLEEYFNNIEGLGVLSTADAEGQVDSAIYATPHVIDPQTIAFLMRPRTSYHNISQNPKAAYIFIEKSAGYQGVRLYLEKSGEETNPDDISKIRRSHHGGDESQARIVYFKVIRTRPLVGDAEAD